MLAKPLLRPHAAARHGFVRICRNFEITSIWPFSVRVQPKSVVLNRFPQEATQGSHIEFKVMVKPGLVIPRLAPFDTTNRKSKIESTCII